MTSTAAGYPVLLDLDGTLVDSVFHHVMAWDRALAEHGYGVPMWRIHAGIGMGSKSLLPWLLGGHVDDAEAVSAAHERHFLERADALRATPGARELLDDLDERQIPFVVATSAQAEIGEALLAALGRRDLRGTNADDVDAPKPAPDLLLAACQELSGDPARATLVGDSPWDAEAASRVGMRMLGVRCGGFGDDRLLEAGAYAVVDSPRELIGRL
jgi:HAD superfamily hydrolase (TIGR01509 family)